MKKIVYILITALLFFNSSCDKTEESDEPYPGVFADETIDLYFRDRLGNDLLDTLNNSYYDWNKIKLFNLIDGELIEYKKLLIEGTYDTGKLFYYRDEINSYCLRLLGLYASSPFNKEEDSNKITFETLHYLSLNENDIDTIQCQFEQGKKVFYSIIMKVWYNNELRWERDPAGNNHLIEVIK